MVTVVFIWTVLKKGFGTVHNSTWSKPPLRSSGLLARWHLNMQFGSIGSIMFVIVWIIREINSAKERSLKYTASSLQQKTASQRERMIRRCIHKSKAKEELWLKRVVDYLRNCILPLFFVCKKAHNGNCNNSLNGKGHVQHSEPLMLLLLLLIIIITSYYLDTFPNIYLMFLIFQIPILS